MQQHNIVIKMSSNDYFDTLETVQKLLNPYIKRMQLENQDSLYIGTIQELKETNPEFLYGLLKGDSLAFDFYYDNFYNPIILPVEIK